MLTHALCWSALARAQIVLGVLYNVSRDYDSAIAAFQKALHAKPDDYSLWNKVRCGNLPPLPMLCVPCSMRLTLA